MSTCFRTSSFSWLNLLGRELIFRLPMTTLFILLNPKFLIMDNGSKNLSFLISSEILALTPPFVTLTFITLRIFKYSCVTRLSKPRTSFFLGIFFEKFNAVSDPIWGDSVALKNYLNNLLLLFATVTLPLSVRCISSFHKCFSEIAPLSIKQRLYFIRSFYKFLYRFWIVSYLTLAQ